MLNDAIDFANFYHSGELDKTNQPAIFHPLRVMMAMNSMNTRICAVLHDVVEDSPATLDEIGRKYGERVKEVIDCLTHRDSEPLDEYYARILTNKIATEVKIADMRDNMSPYRMNGLAPEVQERMMKKYKKGFRILTEGEI